MTDEVLAQAPLFAALDEEAAEALRASMVRRTTCPAASRCSPRATRATGST